LFLTRNKILMKFTFYFLITFFTTASVYSQQLGDYKYIIIPEQFEFLDEVNKYGLNIATKQQLNKYGFEAFIVTEALPFNVKDNICDILNLSVEDNSSFIRTKIKIILKDCEDKVVFESAEGDSKEKNYQKTYQEAFKEALLSFKGLVIKKSRSEETIKEVQTVSNEKQKTEEVIKPNAARKVAASTLISSSSENIVEYSSSDNIYSMTQEGNTLTFFEGQKEIGVANAIANTKFPVKTSEFTGVGYFDDGNLIIERSIKGVGKVQMKFLKK